MFIKNRTKKGFTLVELLVTIVLLGIIGVIVIYNMTSVTKNSKENEYDRFIATIKSAADVYANLNPDAFNDLYVSKAFLYITIEDLVKDGLLDEKIENPYTKKKIALDELIKANLDSQSGALTFEYPVEKKEEESFLVAISDYVVWGEPYNCMQGAGTYELALSEEDGSLVMLNNAETIKKYNFQCTMPSEFRDYSANPSLGKATQNAGTYEISYTWVTESGTRKSATRTLRVLPKVIPTVKVYDQSGSEYNYDLKNPSWYTPTYNVNTKQWSYLTYKVHIEGADISSSTYKITKKANSPIGGTKNVTNNYTNDFGKTYVVDDGDKTYSISTIVKGHHNAGYSYETTGNVNIKSKLTIPPTFINGASDTWSTTRNFDIKDTYSPVGVANYEYRLVGEGGQGSINNTLSVENTNTFPRTGSVTTKGVDVYSNNCNKNEIEYKYIYFRAINNDGYVGDWTPVVNAYLTNRITNLILEDSDECSSSNNCCLKSGSSCYYTKKVKYLRFGTSTMNVLERTSSGNLLTSLVDLGKNAVSPTTISNRTWGLQTCDGYFSVNYSLSSPALEVLVKEAQQVLNTYPSNYLNYINMKNWTATGFVNAKLPVGSKKVRGASSVTASGKEVFDVTYDGFAGVPNKAQIEKYGDALSASKSYWVASSFYEDMEIYVDTPSRHGNHTTVYNSYFYGVDYGASYNFSKKYISSLLHVKPLVEFKPNITTCRGTGTAADPYIINS